MLGKNYLDKCNVTTLVSGVPNREGSIISLFVLNKLISWNTGCEEVCDIFINEL